MVETCRGTTADGKPCAARPRPGSSWCPWHDPDLSDRRSEWSAKGGSNRSNRRRAKRQLPAEPLTAEEVHAYLGVVFRGVIGGTTEPGVATAAANVARAMMDVAKASDLEERMAEIERRLGAKVS
jgi:hypothetical protein